MAARHMHHPHLLGRLLLRFSLPDADTDTPQNLSAAARDGAEHLWVASDELGFLERLSPEDPRIVAKHERFRVADALALPPGDEEIDIEALGLDGDSLWMIGSHSTKRKKPKGKDPKEDLKRLALVEKPTNRLVLARLPLVKGRRGRAPAKNKGQQLARTERDGAPSNALLDVLNEDEHLGPFVRSDLPSKDNGLDIEGLAVRDRSVLLGLRGPVLRGFAVLLMIELAPNESGDLDLSKKKHRKLFLDLDGLGIRELSFVGDDVLILAGPTMCLDGAIRLYRLRNPLAQKGDTVIHQDDKDLVRLFDIPHAEDKERAEGVTLFSWFGENDSILVVYDSPAPERLYEPHAVFADVFRIG